MLSYKKPAVLAFCILMASAVTAQIASAQRRTAVTIGQIAPIALFWPDFIAHQKGFYAAEGLDADSLFVGSVAAAAQQTIAGSIDISFTTAEIAIRAASKGGDIVIIGETVYKWPYSFMATKDIKKPQDLKGKKVILSTPKQDLTILWEQWLRDNGMAPSDVDQVFDGATPNRYAALAKGAVQCAVLSQPFDFRAISEGYTQLFDTSFMKKNYSFVVIAARGKWVHDYPDATRAVVRAISNAIDWWYDPKNRDEAINILQKVSKQDRTLIEKTYDYYHDRVQPYPRGAALGAEGFQNLLDVLASTNEVNIRPVSFYARPSAWNK
jgi:ABC-type nitrate/sulfonate/bicarbonate transport system substrate-binding protein